MALDLPEHERAALAAWRDRLIAGRDDLRPVREEALHVTLAFLGWRPEKEIPKIAEAVRRAVDGVPTPVFEQRSLVAVPRRRPRLFALGLHDESDRAAGLQQAVSDGLEAACFYRPEKRPWWPHVTLARVKRGSRAEPLLGDPRDTNPFRPSQVTLYRSNLRPQGAEYEPLAKFPLAR